jgi:hypothetical protein
MLGGSFVIVAVFALIVVVIRKDGVEPWKIVKHGSTTLAALLAVVGSVLQAKRANERSQYSSLLEKDGDQAARPIHHYDYLHFKHVSTLWYVVFAGAAASLAGETIDFLIDKN